MNYLVISGTSRFDTYPTASVIKSFDLNAQVHLVRCQPVNTVFQKQAHHYETVQYINIYKQTTDETAAQLEPFCREMKIDRIISTGEEGILVAALLRDRLNLDGQDTGNALLFRDKVLMKQKAQELGLRIPRFSDLISLEHATAFANATGTPLILKRKSSLSSMGVKKITAMGELAPAYESIESEGLVHDYQIEEFITGELYQVNGYVVDGAPLLAWPSKCSTGCFEFAAEDKPMITVTVDKADPAFIPMMDYTSKLVEGFGLRNSTFHFELFRDKRSGEVVMLEVASRVGGDPIPQMMLDAFQIDLDRVSICLQAGIDLEQLQQTALEFSTIKSPPVYSSAVIIPKKTGVLVQAAKDPPHGIRMISYVRKHNQYYHWQVLDSVACKAYAKGVSQEDSSNQIQNFVNWYENNHIWKSNSNYSKIVRGLRKITQSISLQ